MHADTNPPAPTDDQLRALVARLPLDRKVRLLTGESMWSSPGEPEIGLRPMVFSDGPVGVRGLSFDERDTAAVLPSPSAQAATWDEDLVHRLGAVLAAEARKKGVDVLLAPTINLHRSPLGGRHFECFSEDPLLTGRIGAAYVDGVQSGGVGATLKHFVANDSETERMNVDVQIDDRTLHELYLRPFEHIITSSDPWLVMSAYNRVNGASMSESPLLDSPLKREWGFDGVVVSDWTAVRSTAEAGAGGNDLAMPGPHGPWGEALVHAVRDGQVPESAIDDKVFRLLRLAARVGALEPAQQADATTTEDIPQLLREAASAGTVLVRNSGDLLPLGPVGSIAVLGPNAEAPRVQGGGSASLAAPYVVSPLDGLRSALPQARIEHTPGARVQRGAVPLPAGKSVDPRTGEPGVRVRFLDADGAEVLTENRRAGRLVWLGTPELARTTSIEVTGRLRNLRPGRTRFGITGVGEFSLDVRGEREFEGTLPNPGGDLINLVFGGSEHLAEFEVTADDEIDFTVRRPAETPIPGFDMAALTLSLEESQDTEQEELDRAVRLARESEVAVVVVGTTEAVESEGNDRTTLELPGTQNDLVRAVAKANPRTVVVINSGSPVAMPWLDDVEAVLLTWFGGLEYGNALADVLLGHTEPGGNLPTTWPVHEQHCPVLSTTPTDGALPYAEGLHIGYRAWARGEHAPAFPFGRGLGYTSWRFDDLTVANSADGGATVRVRVRNTGERAGRQLVQVYLSRVDGSVERPALWLGGFAHGAAEPGESVEVDVPVSAQAFQHWDTADQRWVVEPGRFTVHAGPDSADLPLTGSVDITG